MSCNLLSCFSSQFVTSPRSKSLSACFSQSDNGKRVSRVSRLQRLISTSIAPEPPAHSLQRPSRRRTTRQRARRRRQETVEELWRGHILRAHRFCTAYRSLRLEVPLRITPKQLAQSLEHHYPPRAIITKNIDNGSSTACCGLYDGRVECRWPVYVGGLATFSSRYINSACWLTFVLADMLFHGEGEAFNVRIFRLNHEARH